MFHKTLVKVHTELLGKAENALAKMTTAPWNISTRKRRDTALEQPLQKIQAVFLYSFTQKRLGKSIARGSRYSLAVQAWEDPKIKQYILKLISITLKREISTMCSDKQTHY